ncbi:MAG: hypothetical protein HAW60_05995, partial [Bdellovibrionales bacterium]|nr:hypothetical protein [Bdellovibrionales bacterium]
MKKLINPLALLNKKGQMAVFIVLIFQVLFVLFAMVINIGLIVHDKINLQNSVDLAAYYVAQRQAESLNAIAHQNYQIRQAWKLLAFRYFVLGTSSMTDSAAGSGNNTGLVHPAAVGKTYSNTDIEGCFDNFQTYTNPSTKSPPGKCHKLPVICISDIYPWKIITKGGVASKDQFCRNLTLTVSSLTAPSNIASFTGVGKTIANVNTFNKILTDTCIYAENMQLVYASSILTAFDREQSNRLKILYSLAKLLGNNKDIDGKSLKAGARKVLNKNLSYANFKGSNKDLKLFNSVD